MKNIQEVIEKQKQYFYTGDTKKLDFRIEQLKRLKSGIQQFEPKILEALYQDLRKGEFEAYATEIGFTLKSIDEMIKNLKKWSKPEKKSAPIYQWPSQNYIMKEPYGVVLIIGPFNYPFQLLIEPMLGAIAAGNTVVLKPSEATPNVSRVVVEMIESIYEGKFVAVIEGEKEVTSELIHSSFDYIFFTGSVPVGKIVMKAAAEKLIPVTLELGGKSPTIIDKTANLEVVAKRVLWGKFTNVGQTCIAPDYVYVHRSVKDEFIMLLTKHIEAFYGSNPQQSRDYGRIVNERQWDRLNNILEEDKEKIIFGGIKEKGDLYISPTILEGVNWEDKVMEDEIFGPILPILIYEEVDEVIKVIQSKAKPLALYIFTEDKKVEAKLLENCQFGGGCVNDTLAHVTNSGLPFGGVGPSGLGAYHGKYSFDTFSHRKSIVKKGTKIDINLVFPPYKDKIKLVRRLLK